MFCQSIETSSHHTVCAPGLSLLQVVLLASRMGSLTQVDFTGGHVVSSSRRAHVFAALLNQQHHVMCVQYGYRMGKAALHMAGATLARDFKEHGIPVGLIHPGVVSFAFI